jgi:branched-chain amino acid transport system permease protein
VLGGFILGGASTALQVGLPLELKEFRDALLFGAVLVFTVIRPGGLYVARSERTRV